MGGIPSMHSIFRATHLKLGTYFIEYCASIFHLCVIDEFMQVKMRKKCGR